MSENDAQLKTKEQIAASDRASVNVTIDVGPPRFARVKVTAEAGIFKNGSQYDQGDEAVISLAAAQQFESQGDVEILGEVDTAATDNAVFEQHGIVTPQMEKEAKDA